MERSVYKSLYKVTSALMMRHNRICNDRSLIASLASAMVCNEYGSEVLGRMAEPYIWQGISAEGYPVIPPTDHPVVITLKGASASGKSSLREAIKKAPSLYLDSEDAQQIESFSVISPDIFRKMFIDYDSLGDAYKYAGALTSEELAIIDRKVDRYIRDKMRETGALHNMLIDRFRFDTFTVVDADDSIEFFRKASELHMFFVVTAPENMVERGWKRGLETGRYRNSEDFLALSKEAYDGMPRKFFHWIDAKGTHFEYKFFNNNVPKGTPFLLAGYGTRDHMAVTDVETFVNISLYARANIMASGPEALYPDSRFCTVAQNTGFLRGCVDAIPVVDFWDSQSGRPYARMEGGSASEILDLDVFMRKAEDPLHREVFKDLGLMVLPEVLLHLKRTDCEPGI